MPFEKRSTEEFRIIGTAAANWEKAGKGVSFVPTWTLTHAHAARMARLPRIDVPNVPQHVVQRGNNRQAIFFHDGDYPAYLGYLREALIKHDCSLDAYVPMTHHVHLLTLR
jgi:hypothetical protein